MTIELTDEQRQALERRRGPVRLQDRQTRCEYVLVRADVFDHMKKLLDTETVDQSLYEFEDLA
jgi:hypothetical protein